MIFIFLLLIFSLPVLWALVPAGFFNTHDGAFHLIRLVHFYHELTSGQFPVRIGTEIAYGYGYPIFNYIYPLLYYLGSLFRFLGFNWGDSLKIIILGATLGSVWFFYLWLRCHFGQFASFVGALFYLYTPYRLVATYVSGGFGILLAFMFLPLILWSLKKGRLLLLAIGITGLILSHNLSAMIFAPLILGYYLMLLPKTKLKSLLGIILGVLLGLGLSAFFLVPALTELPLVHLSFRVAENYRDHFPAFKQLLYSPWGYGYSVPGASGDGLTLQVGLAQWLVVGLAFLVVIIKRRKVWLPIFFLLVFAGSIYLMLPESDFIWQKFPIIQQLQFPWRLLSLTMPVTAWLAAWVVDQKKISSLLGFLLIILLLRANWHYRQPLERVRHPDKYYLEEIGIFSASTDISWETLPVWVREIPTNFPLGKIKIQVDETTTVTQLAQDKGEEGRFNLQASQNTEAIINTFYFPSWQVLIDGRLVPTQIVPKSGLIKIKVPKGEHILSLKIVSTPIQKLANRISLVSSSLFLGILMVPKLLRRSQKE